MATDSEVVTTPGKELSATLSPQHDFSEKINDVDVALKSRYAADKNAKQKWAEVVKVMTEFEMDAPRRRPSADNVAYYVKELRIYEKGEELTEDEEKMRHIYDDSNYQIKQLEQYPELIKWLDSENTYPKFSESIQKMKDAYYKAHREKKLDKDATKAGRDKLQAVIDTYLEALEAYDETFEQVSNVKEYISIVKDVAEIKAIADGNQQ